MLNLILLNSTGSSFYPIGVGGVGVYGISWTYPWEQAIHGVSTGIKQEVINLDPGNYVTDSGFLKKNETKHNTVLYTWTCHIIFNYWPLFSCLRKTVLTCVVYWSQKVNDELYASFQMNLRIMEFSVANYVFPSWKTIERFPRLIIYK